MSLIDIGFYEDSVFGMCQVRFGGISLHFGAPFFSRFKRC